MDPFLDRIHLGDCREMLAGLADASVDLVVSSPPYNIGKEYETRRALGVYLAEQTEVLAECVRILKPTGSIFWQVGSYSNKGALIPLDVRFFPILEDLGLQPRNRITWVKSHGLHARNKFSARHESILWFSKSDDYLFDLDAIRVPQKYPGKTAHRGPRKGQVTSNPAGKNPGDVWYFPPVAQNHPERTIHPAVFPEGLVARIVLATTRPGGLVVDPYMGTGTVAVVARDHGRHFAGAELRHDYHEVAERRVSGEPDAGGRFANLKTLRAYVQRTGRPIADFRFDVQVGRAATEAANSRVFSEEHHAEQVLARLSLEADAFETRIAVA